MLKKAWLWMYLIVVANAPMSAYAAAVLTVADNISDNITVNPSNSQAGTFDLTGLLNPLDDVTSATVTFIFGDDGDSFSFSSSYISQYYPPDPTPPYARYRYQTDYYQEEGETATVTLADTSASTSSTYSGALTFYRGTRSTGTYVHHYEWGSYSCGFWGMSTCYYQYPVNGSLYTDLYDHRLFYNNIGGISFDLSAAALADLNQDGMVSYLLAAPVGDFVFRWAVLSATVERQTLSTPTANGVPEPTTLALFGLGLAGIGAMRRRKLAV